MSLITEKRDTLCLSEYKNRELKNMGDDIIFLKKLIVDYFFYSSESLLFVILDHTQRWLEC